MRSISKHRAALVAALVSVLGCDGSAALEEESDSLDGVESALNDSPKKAWGVVNANGSLGVGAMHNSTGASVTSSRTSAGVYKVNFFGASSAGGNAFATSFGATNVRCKASALAPGSNYEEVTVRCHAPSGVPTDASFFLAFTSSMTNWPNAPTTAAFATVAANASNFSMVQGPNGYNSAGEIITVEHSMVGRYAVNVHALNSAGGYLALNAMGNNANFCKASGYQRRGTNTYIYVNCYATNGQFADTPFSLLYSENAAFMFDDYAGGGVALDNPSTSIGSVSTPLAHQSWDGCLNSTSSVTRTGTGTYRVVHNALRPVLTSYPNTVYGLNTTALGAGPHGDDGFYCNIAAVYARGNGIATEVRCFDPSGAPVNGEFIEIFSMSNVSTACSP